MTFREASERVSAIASGLVDLAGLKPQDKVIIYADTKRDWQLTAQACFRMNLTVVTIYATLGEDGYLTIFYLELQYFNIEGT